MMLGYSTNFQNNRCQLTCFEYGTEKLHGFSVSADQMMSFQKAAACSILTLMGGRASLPVYPGAPPSSALLDVNESLI
jgi:hypothetical protein